MTGVHDVPTGFDVMDCITGHGLALILLGNWQPECLQHQPSRSAAETTVDHDSQYMYCTTQPGKMKRQVSNAFRITVTAVQLLLAT